MSLGVVTLGASLDVKPQLYAGNLKSGTERPRPFFESAGFLLLSMFGLLVKMCLLVSVFFSAPPSQESHEALGHFW